MSGQKLERLLNLTALLLDARLPLTAEQIQRQLGYPDDLAAFRRAFERDKDELRTMGIPLRVERVPGVLPEVDGYRIPREEYALRDPGLTTEELAALHPGFVCRLTDAGEAATVDLHSPADRAPLSVSRMAEEFDWRARFGCADSAADLSRWWTEHRGGGLT